MAAFIASESAFFCTFIVAYLFYIGKDTGGPTPREVLELPKVILNSIALLSSSATIVLALRGLRRGSNGVFILWTAVTIVLGLLFLAGTAVEWRTLIVDHGLTIATNLFGTTFYSLVGAHAAHVTLGLTMLLVCLMAAMRGGIGAAHAERVELVSWYWHFVDVVWIVVFTVVYIVGR